MELVEKDDVAYISFATNKRNTLTTDSFDKLSAIFSQISKRPTKPCAIVLQSKTDKVFSYGADPKFFNSINLSEKKRLFVSLMNFCKIAINSQIPFIVDINGPAKAGGAIIASLSDFALVNSEHAVLSFSEVKVGIPIPHCLFRIVERRVSKEYFSEMFLLGENFEAQQLLDMNFATALYKESSEEELNKLIARIKRIDKYVMAFSLRNRNKHVASHIDDYIRHFDDDFIMFLSSKETQKGFEGLEGLQV